MPGHEEARNDAGTADDEADGAQALAARLDELEQTVQRQTIRQRAVIHALARITGFASAEVERLAGD